jgi:fibronectin-binding autotransporter adhesin
MAANTIPQLTTGNTFQHWLTATQSLITNANLLNNGAGSTFYANTRLEIGGTNATLNVVTSATINDLIGTTSNITTSNTVSLQARNLNLTENLTSTLKTTGAAFVGTDLTVYGNSTIAGNTTISGDLTVSGNIILDAIGFDDLNVNGSATIANTLSVTGNSTFSNANVTSVLTANIARITTANITTANIVTSNIATANIISLVGLSNTAIYAAISDAANTGGDSAVALAIALG